MKVKLTLEYDGRPFCGWQEQSNQRSVQGELERALSTFVSSRRKQQGLAETIERIPIMGSGRTDSGVHARGQVASFRWPDDLPFDRYDLLNSLNGITPVEISITDLERAEDSFDARFTRHRKQYSYRYLLRRGSEGFYTGRAWRVPQRLDIAAMCEGARALAGRHDFSSFRAGDCIAKTSERILWTSEVVREDADIVRYVVQGNGFLKQMIRIIAGTLLEVGKGTLAASDIKRILEARSRDAAGATAPAHGLVLDWVKYRDDAEVCGEDDE